MQAECLAKLFYFKLVKSYEILATSRNIGLLHKNIKWDCFNLTDKNLLESWLNTYKPDLVIHCAAIVNVDFCEENINLTKDLHLETTRTIANYMQFSGGRLIYISTDSVFNGKKTTPYSEIDNTDPLNVYAQTKLEGEQITLSIKNSLVLRTNIIGWTDKHKTSFFEWLLENLIEKRNKFIL